MPNSIRENARLVQSGSGKHAGKLFAAEARERIHAAHGLAQRVRDLRKNSIAHQVAVGIVDRFKMIDVDQQQRKRAVIPEEISDSRRSASIK